MAQEQLTESLQESVLAVLAFDQTYGELISSQVTPEHFDGVYHDVASVVLAYRRQYHKPPGESHLESLFSRAKLDPGDRKTHVLRRTLFNLSTLAETLNAEYVASRTQDHVRSQKLKTALLAANERYAQGGDEAVPEVEGILNSALRFRQETLDAGTFLSDTSQLDFGQSQEEFYSLGIPQLDRMGIGPAAKQLLLYIAPKSSGKTWFCIHSGRQALLQKAKVVHVSLEMDEARIRARYYQSFFGIARRAGIVNSASFELDQLDRLSSIKVRRTKPKLVYADPSTKKILRNKIRHWGSRFDRLVVKHFPSGTLTLSQLRGYLDYLEITEKFIPNMLIVDYPFLMKMDADNLRIAFGQLVVGLRGLADERNLALVAPTQSNRAGIGAKRVGSTNAMEDISTVFTADTVLSYSRTEAEEKLGLARLRVEHAREAETGVEILLTQAYGIGQYIADSTVLSGTVYWDQLKELTGEDSTIGD